MNTLKIKRLDKNLILINDLIVFMQNKHWYSCDGREIEESKLNSLQQFLRNEQISLNLINQNLNEWNFLIEILNQLNHSDEIQFKIINRFDNNPDTIFTGIIKDSKGNKYELSGDESEFMFRQAIVEHSIIVQENFENKVLIFILGDILF